MKIQSGYTPGLLGSGPTDFLPRLSSPTNQMWHVSVDGTPAASIAIDGEDLSNNRAHLRWFILDDSLRGSGLGARLLDTALDFADKHDFCETQLWTFQGLDAARHLYTSRDFTLTEEYNGNQWGVQVREQIFIRPTPT